MQVDWLVSIESARLLRSLEGLGNLIIRGSLVIKSNPLLTSLTGLSVSSLDELEVKHNYELTSLHGLHGLATTRGQCLISDNKPLRSLSGLDSLALVGGRFRVWDQPALRSLDALRSLTHVWGGVEIFENSELRTLQGLNGLATARLISVRTNRNLLVLGGLLSESVGTLIGELSIDEASWPRCVAPQEHGYLSNSSMYLTASRLPRSPEAVWEQWANNSCGPRAKSCWFGMDCRVNLTGSDFTGKVFLTDRSCGPCSSSRANVSVGADMMVDLTSLAEKHDVGNYSLCRCLSGELGAGPVAHLSILGPRRNQSFLCTRGHVCSLDVSDHGLAPYESVVTVMSRMSGCGGGVLAGGRAIKGAGGEYLIEDHRALALAEPNLYELCWAPPCSRANGSACAGLVVGFLRIKGLFIRDERPVTVGDTLVVPAIGEGVHSGDCLRLLPTCGRPGSGDLSAVSNESLLFSLTVDASHAKAGEYRKCWCQPSQSVPCDAFEHFIADSGRVRVLCPTAHEPSDAGGCRPCQVGRYTTRAGTEECAIDSWYVFVLASYCAIVCTAVFVILSPIRRLARIEDVSTVGGQTFVKTVYPHRWYMHGRASFAVHFRGTANPGLDTPGEPLRARATSIRTLEVLDMHGRPVSKRLDTSRGIVALPLRQELWHRAWPAPPLLAAPLLAVGASLSLLLLLERRDARHVAIGTAVAFVGAMTLRLFIAFVDQAQVSHLDRHIEAFRRSLLKSNPRPAACDRGPDRAVELGELFRMLDFFHSFIRDRTAYYLDGNIVGPLTRSTQLSYAELVGPKKVTWFVSHFWGGQFQHLCSSLRKHAESVYGAEEWKGSAYWICFLSNNQYRLQEELGSSVLDSSFFLALQCRQCDGVCMVLDDLALPLTRSWCIFELLQTFRLERSSEHFCGLLLCTTGGVLNLGQGSVEVSMNLARRIGNLDLESAKASCRSDKDMINAEVIKSLGSFDAMNRLVRHKMRDILLKAREHANEHFEELFVLLGSSASPPPSRESGGEGAAGSEERPAVGARGGLAAHMPKSEWVSV